MNQTSSAPGASLLPDGVAAITTIHFAVIAILAVLVVIGLLWGIKLKRSRVQARRQVESHAEEAGVPVLAPGETADSDPAPAPAPESAPTSAPTPAPIPRMPDAPAPTAAQTPATETLAPDPLADEPIAAAAPQDATPASLAAAAPTGDDPADRPVTLLKGLGPKVAGQLAGLGITTVGQLAALSPTEAEALDAQLGAFTGRMGRDRWIEQARLLASGDRAGFEAVFGKL